ncbi:hypothetical protein DM02DRAFT_391587 [Periconia macrospinosa]|uniref:Uncharacterized protein n=1 Tax=Periconia macrospinosa TaxID=97972 RepID=A0A2V1DQG3_9PLEO|nr:hypothetical protein DM02DRAFT_391587 [Periconia macrospinosa]
MDSRICICICTCTCSYGCTCICRCILFSAKRCTCSSMPSISRLLYSTLLNAQHPFPTRRGKRGRIRQEFSRRQRDSRIPMLQKETSIHYTPPHLSTAQCTVEHTSTGHPKPNSAQKIPHCIANQITRKLNNNHTPCNKTNQRPLDKPLPRCELIG